MPQAMNWNGSERRQYPRICPQVTLVAPNLSDHPQPSINASRGAVLVLVEKPQRADANVGIGLIIVDEQQIVCDLHVVRVSSQPEGYYVAVSCTPHEKSRRLFDSIFAAPSSVTGASAIPIEALRQLKGARNISWPVRVCRAMAGLAAVTAVLPAAWQRLELLLSPVAAQAIAARYLVVLWSTALMVGAVCLLKVLSLHWKGPMNRPAAAEQAKGIGLVVGLWIAIVISVTGVPMIVEWLFNLFGS